MTRWSLSKIPNVLSGVVMIVGMVILGGCFPQTVPLASLPVIEPEASALNMKGIDEYHIEKWESALQFFQAALSLNPILVEAHFNTALTLHQLERHKEAAQHFKRAGELDPENQAIVQSTLYRNHLGLSSTLERHLSGGYRYQ